MFGELIRLSQKYNITISEGECFKQAVYNNKMTDSGECIIDKIELTIKHYPNHDIILSTYTTDHPTEQHFAVALPYPKE